MIEVRDAAADPGALAAFLRLPEIVYQGDPHYIATAPREVLASLRRPEFTGAQRMSGKPVSRFGLPARATSPPAPLLKERGGKTIFKPLSFRRGVGVRSLRQDAATFQAPSQRILVALEGREPVARLVARRSPALRDEAGRPYGMLGFFEARDGHEEAVTRLFQEGIAWLRQSAAGPIVGPMDGDTWHRYRLNVGPFDEPPFLLEPYNPPWYERLWTANGFAVLERYFSKRVEAAAVVAHLEPRRRAVLRAGYQLRPLDPRRYREELRTIYELSRRIFARNFLYTEIPEEEFHALYAGARALIDPELVWFAHSPGGEDVGFLFAYPDLFRAVAAMRGERGLLAKLRFLLHRREAGAVDFKTLGVLPEHRRSGVAAALFHEGHRQALEKGYRVANHCLFKEGNPSGELDGGAGRLLRTYHLYRWQG